MFYGKSIWGFPKHFWLVKQQCIAAIMYKDSRHPLVFVLGATVDWQHASFSGGYHYLMRIFWNVYIFSRMYYWGLQTWYPLICSALQVSILQGLYLKHNTRNWWGTFTYQAKSRWLSGSYETQVNHSCVQCFCRVPVEKKKQKNTADAPPIRKL